MEQLTERLSHIKMFVLDMDGTIYLGEHLFPFTKRFLSQVMRSGREYCFFTNNSSKNREAYLKKLSHMGIEIAAFKRSHPGVAEGKPSRRELLCGRDAVASGRFSECRHSLR